MICCRVRPLSSFMLVVAWEKSMNNFLNAISTTFSSSNKHRSGWISNRHRAKRLPKQKDFQLEPLESRLLLSVGVVGVPDWVAEGPGPQISAGNVIGPTIATQQDVGAVNALAVDPTNAKHVFAATV